MYGSTRASSYVATHANNNNSTIKEVLDSWYLTNIESKGYEDQVSKKTGFCGDREPSTSSSAVMSPTGLVSALFPLLLPLTVYISSLFLHFNVGLFTADEVAMAGGVYGQTNESYYLYTNSAYWTMSPCSFNAANSYAGVFFVVSDGIPGNANVNGTIGVRPVINLASNVTIRSGNGTS